MTDPEWKEMLERIPGEWHEGMTFAMTTGTEIVTQSLLRVEATFALVRGRTMGSADAGKLLIVPFDRISHIYFAKPLAIHVIEAAFGELQVQAEAPKPDDEAAEEAAGEPEPAAAQPNKAELLAKLRARFSGQ